MKIVNHHVALKAQALLLALLFGCTPALAQNAGTATNHAFLIGKGPGTQGYTSLLCGSAQLAVGQSAADPICRTLTGDVTITAGGVTAIGTAKVTSAMLRDSAALSVIGRSANTTGVPADIAAANDNEVLRRSGTSLGFGTIATGGISDAAVTYAKIQNLGALELFGRGSNSSGVGAGIAASAGSSCAFRESSNTISCGTLATAAFAANAVTNAKLAQMANNTVKCRVTAGTGDPEDCTATQGRSVLGLGTAAQQNTGTSGANVPLLNGNNTHSGSNAFAGAFDAQQAVSLTGDISPSQITSNQNNYAPTGFSTATVLRLSTDASRDLTGLAGGSDGRVIAILNTGSQNLVIRSESGSSTAANRFALSGDLTMNGSQGATFIYDATSSRWRMIGAPPSTGGGGGGDVTGPASSTDNAIVRFDGTTGKIIQDSGVSVDDSNNVSGVAQMSASTVAGSQIASQSDQETGSATNKIVTPGRQQYHPSAAKAWAVVANSGTASVTTGFNVSGATRNSLGNVSVNFTTSFSSSSYVCVASNVGTSVVASTSPASASTVRVSSYYVLGAASIDNDFSIVCYGDQ